MTRRVKQTGRARKARKPLRVLMYTASRVDPGRVRAALRRGGYEPELRAAGTPSEIEAALDEGDWDAAISDCRVGKREGIGALELLKARGIDIPLILVSGRMSVSSATSAIRAGAHDCILKKDLRTLADRLRDGIALHRARRRQASKQQQLETSERRYRALFETNPVPMWLYDNKTLKIVDANAAAVRQYGYGHKEFREMSVVDLHVPEARPAAKTRVRTRSAEATEIRTSRHQCKDGTALDVETTSVPFPSAGRPMRLVAARDLSAERQARRSAAWFYNVFHALPVAGCLVGLESGRVVDANEAYLELVGRARSRAIGAEARAVEGWNTPEERDALVARLAAGEPVRDAEAVFRRASGEERHVLLSMEKIEGRGETLILKMIVDITDRQRDARAIARAGERFSKLFYSSPLPMSTTDLDTGRIHEANDALLEFFGYTREEVVGRTVLDLNMYCDASHRARFVEKLKRGEPVRNAECPVRTKTGEKRDVLFSLEPIELEGKQILLGMFSDITARRAMEEKLRESEKHLARAQRIAQLGSWELDMATGRLHWSDETFRIFGLTPSEFGATYEAFIDRVHPEDRSMLQAAQDRALSGEARLDIEHRIVRPDGDMRWVQQTGELELDPAGTPAYLTGTVLDITARRHAEAQLRDAEARFRIMFEQAGIGIALVDFNDGRILQANRALSSMLGYGIGELCSLTIADVSDPRDYIEDERLWREMVQGKHERFQLEKRYRRKDGNVMVGMLTSTLLRDTHNQPQLIVGMLEDVTERRRAEEALRASERTFRELVELLPAAVYVCDSSGRIEHYNIYAAELWGRAPRLRSSTELFSGAHRMLGRDGTPLGHSECPIARVLRTGKPVFNEELVIERPDGSRRNVIVNAMPRRNEHGALTGAIESLTDITRRIEIEHSLVQANRQLQAIPARILGAQEDERRRLSRELHDEIGQELTALRLSLKNVAKHSLPEDAASDIEACVEIVGAALESARRISSDLRPPQLDHLGLEAALQWLVDQQHRAGRLDITLESGPMPKALPPEVAIACYRIAQEALTNVARHARASTAALDLRMDNGTLRLTVRDDGCGFDARAARAQAIEGAGLGLLGMQERVEQVNGSLQVDSAPSKGTVITAFFPLAGFHDKK